MSLNVPEKNLSDLTCRMGDIASFASMLYAWRPIAKVLRMNFTVEGIFLSELAADGNILLFIFLRSKNFAEYVCDGPGLIAVSTAVLYKILSTHHQHDEARFIYRCGAGQKKKEAETLLIEILNDDENVSKEYMIPLLRTDTKMFESLLEQVNLVARFPSESFNAFINALVSIEIGETEKAQGQIYLYVNENEITVEKENGSLLKYSRLSLLTAQGVESKRSFGKRITDTTIKKTFHLAHLAEVKKFFEIKKSNILIYIKKEPEQYPTIFEVQIGSLGSLRIFLSPVVN